MSQSLILIPGLLNTAGLFAEQIEALSGSWAITVADHTRDDSLAGMATRLLADAPPTFALAGLSMGGYLAMEIMRRAPERVTRLALLDTSARPDTESARRDRERLIQLVEKGRFSDIPPLLWAKTISPARQSDRDLKARVIAMMEEVGPDAYMRQQHAIMARPDSRETLATIEIPTLILVGSEDTVTPPEVAREMADLIEWSSLVEIPNAGHLSSIEQPNLVTSALRHWLQAG
ncbi:alpha/beta fold hydrolase [Microvirga sp. 2MCAF38]|uniref:alpha/beta fold hydrolase n=1 Tax=Microvirga sp. 2MCAF38 TaxID=3232989 RepID=UPI003F96C30A